MSKEARALRSELRQLALTYAAMRNLPHYESLGKKNAAVLFPAVNGRHGNFIDASYQAARRAPEPTPRRFLKRHPQSRVLPPEFRNTACELDSSNSSDALLMNIFCHPELGSSRVPKLLGLDRWTEPAFGVRFCVAGEEEPRSSAHRDRRTEIDLVFSADLAIEAKLTEAAFQQASAAKVRRYRHLEEVFDVEQLPRCKAGFDSYQLLRNVLAAYQRGGRFMVLYDRRRPDLLKRWEAFAPAIRISALRNCCSTMTWQEIAAMAPDELRLFLVEKYGIS